MTNENNNEETTSPLTDAARRYTALLLQLNSAASDSTTIVRFTAAAGFDGIEPDEQVVVTVEDVEGRRWPLNILRADILPALLRDTDDGVFFSPDGEHLMLVDNCSVEKIYLAAQQFIEQFNTRAV